MLATLCLLLALLLPGQGVQVPANDGWVTDLAGMLDARQEASLEALMESYRQGSGQELALLTLPDLGGRTIEEVGLEVARAWNVGHALLVVARDERKVRIEVGRSLEGDLPDAIAGRIIHDVILPRFREGDFPAGLRDGVVALHHAAGGEYGELPPAGGERSKGRVTFWLLIWLVFVFLGTRGGRRGRGGRGGGSGWVVPWILMSSGSGGRGGGFGGGGGGGGGFGGFSGGGGFGGGGASGGW